MVTGKYLFFSKHRRFQWNYFSQRQSYFYDIDLVIGEDELIVILRVSGVVENVSHISTITALPSLTISQNKINSVLISRQSVTTLQGASSQFSVLTEFLHWWALHGYHVNFRGIFSNHVKHMISLVRSMAVLECKWSFYNNWSDDSPSLCSVINISCFDRRSRRVGQRSRYSIFELLGRFFLFYCCGFYISTICISGWKSANKIKLTERGGQKPDQIIRGGIFFLGLQSRPASRRKVIVW